MQDMYVGVVTRDSLDSVMLTDMDCGTEYSVMLYRYYKITWTEGITLSKNINIYLYIYKRHSEFVLVHKALSIPIMRIILDEQGVGRERKGKIAVYDYCKTSAVQ
jgi:hypothetical protein